MRDNIAFHCVFALCNPLIDWVGGNESEPKSQNSLESLVWVLHKSSRPRSLIIYTIISDVTPLSTALYFNSKDGVWGLGWAPVSFIQSGSALQMEQNIRLKMLCWGTLKMLDGFADSQLNKHHFNKSVFLLLIHQALG